MRSASRRLLLLPLCLLPPPVGAARPLGATRHTVPFPRRVLAQFLADADKAVPGARIDAPPFAACGHLWQLSLYPFGGSRSPGAAYRVGIYLKLLDAAGQEVDATFSLRLAMAREDLASAERTVAPRGLTFRCGMTFCAAREAGQTVGRCEDWGAHVYSSNLLIRELEVDEQCGAVVDIELQVWGERPCRAGSSVRALLEQTSRLPRGKLRAGEVVVALGSGGGGGGQYRCVPGVEYRIMRLARKDGDEAFTLDVSKEDGCVYMLPTSKQARAVGSFASNEEEMAAILSAENPVPRLRHGAVPPVDTEGVHWPVAVATNDMPEVGSRLSLRAIPARLGLAVRTRLRLVLLFVLLGAFPLWGGYLLSQIGSAYAIPSRSMEATLRVGDVVLGEKVSRAVGVPYHAGDLVLFSPPGELQKLVEKAGSKLGPRDVFVKRVAAVGGDTVELLPSGDISVNGVPRARPALQCKDEGAPVVATSSASSRVIPAGSLFVLGDCPARSTDSRVWGPLPEKNVVARPVVRIWPPGRQGAIDGAIEPDSFLQGLRTYIEVRTGP